MNNLTAAFADMRKEGLLARQNFLCCQNCAGYALTEMAEKRVKAGKPFKGVVYYHAQDAAQRDNDEDFHLGYGNADSTEMGKLGLPTKEVGEIVIRCLKGRGVGYEWTGDDTERILVTADSRGAERMHS